MVISPVALHSPHTPVTTLRHLTVKRHTSSSSTHTNTHRIRGSKRFLFFLLSSRILMVTQQPPQESMGREDDVHSQKKISEYEQSREDRIRENLERMEKLGILDLSLKLKSLNPTPNRTPPHPRKKQQPSSTTPLPPSSGPVRRSSRLQNSTPVSYCEVQMPKKDKSQDDDLLRLEGSRPEVYTEEHEKLLGSTEMSWTLFVDGYGKDGKRIYDPVRGKTCHQCRQKTLGHRTHCSQCNMVQGQFCGDCLYTRYGENVLEANKNPNWICPVCRGICNCSLCRQAKGWPPTGTLYRKISSLGYKSVAHYLIQTRRANTNSDETDVFKVPTSAKRSLPFTNIEGETTGENDLSLPNCEYVKTDPLPEVIHVANDDSDVKIMEETYCSKGDDEMTIVTGGKLLQEPAAAYESKDKVEVPINPISEKCGSADDKDKKADKRVDIDENIVELKSTADTQATAEPEHDHFPTETLDRDDEIDIKRGDCTILENKTSVAPETTPKSSKKIVRVTPTLDSIAGRLRLRRSKTKENEEINANCLTGNEETTPMAGDSKAERSRQKRNARDGVGSTDDNEDAGTIADGDRIGRRLKMRRRSQGIDR